MNTHSTRQSCAACKHQRRKCSRDCPLAPYFPANRQSQFLNVHKLFGISNVLKILREMESAEMNAEQKKAAMGSIIYHANKRAADPVGGCFRVIQQLQSKIDHVNAELQFVQQQLTICRALADSRYRFLQQEVAKLLPTLPPINDHHHQDLLTSEQQHRHLQPNIPSPSPSLLQHHHHQQPQGYLEDIVHHHLNQNINQQQNPNPNPTQIINIESSSSSSSSHVNEKLFNINKFEDIKPLLGMFDNRQQYQLPIDDPIQSSDKATLEEEEEEEAGLVDLKGGNSYMEQVPEHDLKGAASLFTLAIRNREDYH